MSLWGFDGEENLLTCWSSLNQFDEVVWSEFGGTSGNNVEPNALSSPSSWLPNEDRRKRTLSEGNASGPSGQEDCGASTGLRDSVVGMTSEDEDASEEMLSIEDASNLSSVFVEGGWADLQSVAADISAESDPFDADRPPVRQEFEQVVDDEIKDRQSMHVVDPGARSNVRGDNAGMATIPLSVSDVSLEDEGILEIFEKEILPTRADSFLEFGWEKTGNLDDMDKLFRSNSFEPVMVSGVDALDWPSSSPPLEAADFGMPFGKSPSISDSSLMKIESHAEDKAYLSSYAIPGKEETEEWTAISSASYAEAGKVSLAQVYRARRQAAHRKRSEDRSKRTTYRKLFPGPPCSIPPADVRMLQRLPFRLPGQIPYLQCTSASSLQSFPSPRTAPITSPPQVHGVPHIHAGYPLHLLPAVSVPPSPPVIHMQNIRPRAADLPQSASQGQRQQAWRDQFNHLASSAPFDTVSRPPTSSLNMTRQEKLEKLRWRQQMQAKLAVEQQQQLLTFHNSQQIGTGVCRMLQQATASKQAGPLASTREQHLVRSPLSTDRRIDSAEGEALPHKDRGEEDKHSLEGSVLRQLKSTVSALDLGTRLCIRDALFRLARSAMDRRAVGSEYMAVSQRSEVQDSDVNAVESSTASGSPASQHSRGTNMSTVETETNPIDRSIANLLFSKPQPPIFGRHYVYT